MGDQILREHLQGHMKNYWSLTTVGTVWAYALREWRAMVAFICRHLLNIFKGMWRSGITSALHAEGPGLNPQHVHALTQLNA